MGLYDHVTCLAPLPVEMPADTLYQSKDTPAQRLLHYEIGRDGVIYRRNLVPGTGLLSYQSVLEGLRRGMLQDYAETVQAEWTREPVGFDGALEFYAHLPEDGRIAFRACFEAGRMVAVETVEHRPPTRLPDPGTVTTVDSQQPLHDLARQPRGGARGWLSAPVS